MEMNVELQAACSSLGYLEKGTYYKEPDCLETIKDVIRYLKREDESCEIRRQIGDSQIVQNDLLPIIKQYKDDGILLETTLRLLVNLSQPAILCFQNQLPGDKTNRNYYLQIEGHLQSYKQAFADEALQAVLTRKLGDLLQLDWEARQEEDRLLIERILILLRNVLHVPPNTVAEGRTDDDATVHDQLLWALHVSGMEDLLLYLGSSEDERQFAFHVLEIISLMFREQTPEQLAAAGGSRALSEQQQDQRELEMVREQEKSSKKAKVMKYSSRHSRFGGTFTMANVKSISNNQMITHRALGQIKDMNFDHNKVPKKIAKNRKPLTEEEATRRSTLSIRLFLKEFCIQFLENCYNPLMKSVKDILSRLHGQDNDETYYLWAMRFFMEFNRKQRKELRVDLVGETLSVQSFHYVQTNLQTYHEMIFSNKKEGKIWSRRMHLALKSYGELLQSINAMTLSKNKDLRENADIIKGNVFYMMEYRDIFLVLLKKFNEAIQSRAFLRDLIEITHLFIKMLEYYCKQHGHLVVQKKKKKVKRKKKRQPQQGPQSTNTGTSEQELDELWDTISGDLSAIFQGRQEIPTDITPFDAASEVEVDQQRAEAMIRIQTKLRRNHPGEAVALFRAAREVWPEEGQFGSQDISQEEEFMALREVFFADIPRADLQPADEFEEETVLTDASDDDEDDVQFESMEQDFDFKGYIRRFAQPLVVKPYSILLRDYKKNTSYTNHSIIKQLHRIGFDCGMVAMLYQASLFRVFQKILCDPACNTSHLQELSTFAKYVVRRFFETAAQNPKVFVEIFFWKTAKESVEVTEGYGTQMHLVKQQWSEEQDDELRRIYDEFKEKREEGMDVIDHIMVHMIDQTKNRRMILKQLKWLSIIESSSDIRPQKKPSENKRGWQEEEELQLRQLFEEFNNSEDPVNIIINGLNRPRSRAVVLNKLLEIGLIQDKRDLRKKRKPGSRSHNKKQNEVHEDEDDEANRSEDSDVNEGESLDLPEEGNQENPDLESLSSSSSSEEDGDNGEDPYYIIQIRKSAKRATQAGHSEAVQWLANCLNRCAEDREEDEDDDQPIPVVPITEEQEAAMDDRKFQNVLKKCGVKSPANEQERFWRIPGNLKPLDLRSRASTLTSCKKTNASEETSHKSSERMTAMRELIQKRTEESRSTRKNLNKTSENKSASPKKKSRVKRMLPSDSDSSDDDRLCIDLAKVKRIKKQRISNSDEDSNKENSQQSQISESNVSSQNLAASNQSSVSVRSSPQSESGSSSRSQSKSPQRNTCERKSSSSSDESDIASNAQNVGRSEENNLETFPATMLSQPLSEDDSEIDDHIPLRNMMHKKTARIASDSEEN